MKHVISYHHHHIIGVRQGLKYYLVDGRWPSSFLCLL